MTKTSKTKAAAATATATATATAPPVRYTEAELAERFARDHAGKALHVRGKGWHVWDGRRWCPDEPAARRLALASARTLWDEARDFDGRVIERSKLIAFAKHAERSATIEATLKLAKVLDGLDTKPGEVDADPWLLNVENGTINLRTGELRQHRPEDRITKLAAVRYDPEAQSPLWERFLIRTVGGDADLYSFLARAVGYSLTGDTNEQVLFYAHGGTATGKSTFIETIRKMLGDYAVTANFETFLKQRNGRGISSDIARMDGARIVICTEADEGRSVDAARLKQMTGQDTVAARVLYQDFFEFIPQFKLWLVANARPRVDASDDAIWRRLVQVPFVNTVPEDERERDLPRRLQQPEVLSAILAWAVRGCGEQRDRGLQVPKRVREYTDEYRHENDHIGRWIEDRCEIGGDFQATTADLRDSYLRWAEANSEPAKMSTKVLGAELRKREFEQCRTETARGWKGIGLRALPGNTFQTTPDGSDGSDTSSGNSPHTRTRKKGLQEQASEASEASGSNGNTSRPPPASTPSPRSRRSRGAVHNTFKDRPREDSK